MGSVHCGHSEKGIFYVYQSGHRGRKREEKKEAEKGERGDKTRYCLIQMLCYGLHAPLTRENEKFAANCHMYTEEVRIIYT